MPIAHTHRAQVHYSQEGEGPALLLLHGTGGDGFSHWGPLQRHLAGHTRLCPDFSGSGQTRDDQQALTLDELVAQALAVIDHSGHERVAVAGYSLGAVVAAALAARYPERVAQLLLVAGFAGGDDARSQLQFGLWRDLAALDTEVMARFLLLTGAHPNWLAQQPAAQLQKRIQAVVRFTQWPGMRRQIALDSELDIRHELARITAPTLCITGSHDQMVPAYASDVLAHGIAGARSQVIEAGHLLPLEQPEALAAAIRHFLAA